MAAHPIELAEEMISTNPTTIRYAIYEQHGDQSAIFRLIGDSRASEINAIIETDGPDVPDSLDVRAAVSPCCKLITPARNLLCAKLDIAHAYMHVPTHGSEIVRNHPNRVHPSGPLKVAAPSRPGRAAPPAIEPA